MDAIGVDAILQLRRLPSLSIQPSQRTRSKKARPVDNTQTHISRAKDWRRDAEASGPSSLDVLILWREEGDNFHSLPAWRERQEEERSCQDGIHMDDDQRVSNLQRRRLDIGQGVHDPFQPFSSQLINLHYAL